MSAAQSGNRWAVTLASRAVRELRKLQRDQSSLGAVHKKIKELSYGHFTMENHRMIRGTEKHIPLFRARAPYDLRIIYQIDVVPDSNGDFDHQVIKIFRIDSRARIDYAFWEKVSVRLKRAKPLYKHRCEQLKPFVNEYCYPTAFLHEDYGLVISNQDAAFQLDDLTEEDVNQIQEITMERFAPLNKSLYNLIVADLDLVFPMVLDEHERKIVHHSGASIVIGRSGTGKTTALIYKMRARDQANVLQGEEGGLRQLFVTRSRVLAQHVEATYRSLAQFTNIAFKSIDELNEMAQEAQADPERTLVELDTEVDLRNDLPKRFSELKESNFPLFISFDTLCSLLEADIHHSAPKANQLGSIESRSLTGFDEFLYNYWPSFKALTVGLEPKFVYSEIIGVIKGSQAALDSVGGHLNREQYVEDLSCRQFPLPTQISERVYSIFESYSRIKRSRRERDVADRTTFIQQNVNRIIGKSKVDYLYVDEVQDNLMIDIHLLRSLAKSIEDIYWSGDSAQTVVAGSAFRIKDLKAFTYRDQAVSSYAGSFRKAPARFETFELNVNFRSLSGIVRFAGFLVRTISDLFPKSIDLMKSEKSKYYGDPPILFTDIQNEAGFFENFLLGSSVSNRVQFGAQQAILVRDAEAAEQLDARLQGLCTVLPIMDSKGLEFDDVLIYNFFSSSPVSPSAWGYLCNGRRQTPAPTLCSELRMLYVAVTRARRRCWIWDSGEVIDRLKAHWIPPDLVRFESASNMAGRLAVSSSQAEWAAKGREYFSHRMYRLARACFQQANHENDVKVSTAYYLMTRAKLKRLRGDSPAVCADLILAASKMQECATLPDIGDPSNFYYHAAICYESAQDIRRAAAAFIQAGRPVHGIQILFHARDFRHGAKLLMANRACFESADFQSLREQARLHFFERQEYTQIAVVFASVDTQLKFARKHNFLAELKHILEIYHRYDELAEEYMSENNVKKAVEWCFRAYEYHDTPASISRAAIFANS